jgi:hypothetical protein
MMPRHICIYMDKSLRQKSPSGTRLTLGYSLSGPLRTHRVGFSFSGGFRCSIGFPSPSSDVLEKETARLRHGSHSVSSAASITGLGLAHRECLMGRTSWKVMGGNKLR